MSVEPNEQVITERLSRMVVQENVIVLKYGPDLLSELNGLAAGKHLFDAVLIDSTQCGYLFPAELFVEAGRLANNLLDVQGAIIFLKADKALAVVRESLMGGLSLHIFDNLSELFDYSATLARHAQTALGKEGAIIEESTDLAQQVLMSTTPVLTTLGIKLKSGMDAPRKRNAVIAAIDNYTPISTISHRLQSQGRLSSEELMEELKGLEQSRAIFPIFSKVPFLVNCFRNQTPFSLKDYLNASRLLTHDQLDELMFELQSMPQKERITLGPLAVKKGFINTRQLEIALQDQAFYGQSGDTGETKLVKSSDESTSQVQSLVGHLGTTDPSNLLQNLATNRETGVLSVEYKDLQFRAVFEVGKMTHAKVGKVSANAAVIEFCSAWKEGIFVFIQRTPPPDLSKESCKVTKPLDKLLLDAALAKDNMDVVLKKLPKGIDSILEKVPDEESLLASTELIDPQEKHKLHPVEIALMGRVWNALDGLTSLSTVLRYSQDLTTSEIARSVGLLMHYGLCTVPTISLAGPMDKFQQLIQNVSEHIGKELSVALLRLSLRDSIGYSGRARVFAMTQSGEIGVDMAAARSSGTSLTIVVQDIENWQVKYIEYVSQELDRDVLLTLIREIHKA
ncbi:MAG TPA: DUF4388 domain-containing protein [Planktothrix sp.]|jgi:hypothetical protein